MKKIFIREERCRRIFEDILGEKFPNVRPSWLLNKKTGYRLELDGYCPKLKLAFEYDGSTSAYLLFPNISFILTNLFYNFEIFSKKSLWQLTH